MEWVDSHAHLTAEEVLPHLDGILLRAQKAQVKTVVNICTDLASLAAGLALEKRAPWIKNAGATTPHDVEKEGESAFAGFAEAARQGRLVAVGETGLDYFYEHSNRQVQQTFLARYLQLAKESRLPVIFHCRDAFSDLFSLVDREWKECRALLHCFTGSAEEAREAVARGWLISFSGIVTFKKSEALRQTARSVPLEKMLIETDTPFLAPQSQRGRMNEPAFVVETAACLAAVRGIALEEMARATTQNALKFFLSE